MATTLLQLVQQASAEMGLAIPNTVAGNTSTDVTQMYYLINAAIPSMIGIHNTLNQTVLFFTALA
jgi:hypothetical protein